MTAELPREVAAIRCGVALARTGETRVVRLSGDGARDTALWALPSRLALRDAQARQSLLLDSDGRPFADVLLCADDEDYLLLIDSAGVDPVAHLREQARGDVTIEDLSIDHDVLEVHGPWAWELVAAVLGSDFTALPYLNFFRLDRGYCVRAGRTGEYGYQIVVPRGESDALYAQLLDVGAREFDAGEIGADALSLAAFENWFFEPSHVPAGATPVELQLQWRLTRDRDFLGKAAIDRRRAEDPLRQVCLITTNEIADDAPILMNDRKIGSVPRAAFSHARGEWIASALVPRELAHGGIDRFTAGGVPVRTFAPPLIDNRSLYVDPQRHAYETRDEVRFGSLARAGGAAMEPRA